MLIEHKNKYINKINQITKETHRNTGLIGYSLKAAFCSETHIMRGAQILAGYDDISSKLFKFCEYELISDLVDITKSSRRHQQVFLLSNLPTRSKSS